MDDDDNLRLKIGKKNDFVSYLSHIYDVLFTTVIYRKNDKTSCDWRCEANRAFVIRFGSVQSVRSGVVVCSTRVSD